jgi:hypothetical protein
VPKPILLLLYIVRNNKEKEVGMKGKGKKRSDVRKRDFVVRDELKCSGKIISGYRSSVTALAKAAPACLPFSCPWVLLPSGKVTHVGVAAVRKSDTRGTLTVESFKLISLTLKHSLPSPRLGASSGCAWRRQTPDMEGSCQNIE